MKILVVEDEQQVAAIIKQGLEEQSIEVDLAFDGSIGQHMAISRDYDVVLVDVVLPGVNGFELCKTIKKEKPTVPVMMLTTLNTTSDKVTGFDSGADDYLSKPFEFAELIARIRALGRRPTLVNKSYNHIWRYEDLRLDTQKKIAYRHDQPIKLSAKEFALLEFFLKNPGRVIPRAELAEKIWDLKFDTGTNVVEVYISMLRNKIDRDYEPKLLHTRIGLGYVLGTEA